MEFIFVVIKICPPIPILRHEEPQKIDKKKTINAKVIDTLVHQILINHVTLVWCSIHMSNMSYCQKQEEEGWELPSLDASQGLAPLKLRGSQHHSPELVPTVPDAVITITPEDGETEVRETAQVTTRGDSTVIRVDTSPSRQEDATHHQQVGACTCPA